MADTTEIKKKYKKFNYPNKLVGLELYYYYLLEFDLLPASLPAEIVMKLFRTISQDFLEDLIKPEDYEAIMQQIFYTYVEHNHEYEGEVLHLFEDAADFTYLKEQGLASLRENLKAYFEKNPTE